MESRFLPLDCIALPRYGRTDAEIEPFQCVKTQHGERPVIHDNDEAARDAVRFQYCGNCFDRVAGVVLHAFAAVSFVAMDGSEDRRKVAR
jgi:hypothetical protein